MGHGRAGDRSRSPHIIFRRLFGRHMPRRFNPTFDFVVGAVTDVFYSEAVMMYGKPVFH